MNALITGILAPNALATSPELIAHLQQQRRGFKFFGSNEDPKVLSRHNQIYDEVLNHLLSPMTLNRIVNSEQYGNEYPLNKMMAQLTDAIFPRRPERENAAYLQLLQGMYLENLLSYLDKPSSSNPTLMVFPLPTNVKQVVYENVMKIRTRLYDYRNVKGFETQGRYLLWETENTLSANK
jgi:hypothetical protein